MKPSISLAALTLVAATATTHAGPGGGTGDLSARSQPGDKEPNIELAKLWWPDQRNMWTPIGWKDHFSRFNVLYNGTVIFEPFSGMASRAHARKWKGTDFQLAFTPWPNDNPPPLPKERIACWRLDTGHGLQGWREDKETPVLWTDFPLQEGMVLREEVFGHIIGGQDIRQSNRAWTLRELRIPQVMAATLIVPQNRLLDDQSATPPARVVPQHRSKGTGAGAELERRNASHAVVRLEGRSGRLGVVT